MPSRARLKAIYFQLLRLGGGERRLLRRIRQHQHVVVLNLHRVSPERNPFWQPLHPDLFDRLLEFLQARFRLVNFRTLSTEMTDRPLAILSFDDGYHDFLDHAWPRMERRGIPCNLNVLPSCLSSGRAIWNVRLYDFLNGASESRLRRFRVPGFETPIPGPSPTARARYGFALSRHLKMRSRREREPLLRDVLALVDEARDFQPTRMLSSEEVRSLPEHVHVGAHSFDHDSMGFEDDAFFETDVDRCAHYFKEELGRDLDTYAFPNGSYRRSQVESLRARGIRHILVVDEGYASRTSDTWPRFTIGAYSASELRFQALGWRASRTPRVSS